MSRIYPSAWTVKAFLAEVRIGKTLFYSEVKAGRIRVVHVGRRTLVPDSERVRILEGGEPSKAAA